MKKFAPVLSILIFATILVIILFATTSNQDIIIVQDNPSKIPINIKPKHYQDTQCGMIILTQKHSAQAINSEGKNWFFDDVGCMVTWFEKQKMRNKIDLWVYTNDTKKWIKAKNAWYSRNDFTPMNYGFGAYEHKHDGFIEFPSLRDMMQRGENLTNPYVRKQLIGE